MSTEPLEQILRETATNDSDSDEEEEEDQWADACEEVPPPLHLAETEAEGHLIPALKPTGDGDFHTRPKIEPDGEDKDKLEDSEKFTDDEIRDLLKRGEALKLEGNDRFRESNWEGAIKAYEDALRTVPRRPLPPPAPPRSSKGKEKEVPPDEDEGDKDSLYDGEEDADESAKKTKSEADEDGTLPTPMKRELTELEKECAATRAAINGNIAACYVKLNKHEEVIRYCTEALDDDPHHLKALHRRATSNEAINTWTSLVSAEKDWKTLLPLLPPRTPLLLQAHRAIRVLPARIEEAKKKETDEMMGKLKELGNTVLGKFGLSTDNFQFTPNGQGGYGMNFVR